MGFDSLFLISGNTLVHQLLLNIIKYYGCACLCISGSNCKSNTVGCACHKGNFSFQ